MFKIGDFSRLSRVPVKTLRYYDEIGLLKPTGIDRFTRYRYYSAGQLPVLNRILALKELGFSLEQVARLLTDNLTPDQLKGMLLLKRAEIEQQLETGSRQLAQIDARLKQVAEDGRMPLYRITLKEVPAMWVAAASGTLPGYDQSEPVFKALFEAVSRVISRQGARPTGPAMALYFDPDSADETARVEAAVPVQAGLVGSDRVKVYQLPAVKSMACAVHHGSFNTLGEVYQATLSWVQANGCRTNGPAREVYLNFAPGSDPSQGNPHQGKVNQNVTEVQIPVKEISKELAMKQPQIVTLDPFKVVGMHYLGKNEHQEITQLWQTLMPRFQEIQHVASGPHCSFGVCFPNPDKWLDYYGGLPVTDLADIPAGMEGKAVPGQTYGVFECHTVEDIGPTYQFILKDWMPASGYRPADGPDFEYYTEAYNPGDPNSVFHIYFPIVKA